MRRLTLLISSLLLLGGCVSAPLSEIDRRSLNDYALCERIYWFTQQGQTNRLNINYRTSVLEERDRRRIDCNVYEPDLRRAEAARQAANTAAMGLIFGGAALIGASQPQPASATNVNVYQQPALPPVNIRPPQMPGMIR